MFQEYLPEEAICGNCIHFRGHYSRYREGDFYLPLHYGHCVYPRLKPRAEGDTCAHFTPAAV